MKEICKKITSVLEWIIGIALAVCLFAGGLGFLGFAAAFIIGGDTAAEICLWLSKVYYAFLIKTSTVTTLLCFVLMYFNGNAKWVNPLNRFKKKESKEN
ncbi:MAG: hypothetical protein IKB86_08865 [Clostridia bacterium]|nr:hypothetical protein [Clostridia bacterium]